MTLGELTKWAEIRDWGADRRSELANWLSGIPVLPGDEAVAEVWGILSAAATRRGRPRPVNDMWIAACCLAHQTSRLARRAHFRTAASRHVKAS